jgi:hypothetical protein
MQTAMPPEKTATSVIEVDPRADRRWDEFVRNRADATVFHLSDWAKVLHRAYGYRPRYLALSGADPDRLEGVLPLFLTRGVMSRKRVRVPAMNAAGPLATDEDGLVALLGAAAELAEREARLLTLQSRKPGLDVLEERLLAIPKNPTWIAPVPAPEDVDLKRWKKHSRNLYRGVNRALDGGLTWREARGREDLRRWYGLYLATMRKRRTLPRSWRLMETTRALLEPRGEFRLFVVERGDRMLAGVVTYPFNGTVDMMYNGSDPEELEARPNHLLNWGVLGWAARNGYSHLDIGDAEEGGPLSRFKMQFGAERVEDYRYDYVINAAPKLEKVRTTGNNFENVDSETLAARAWAHIPLPALRAAGTAIYRFL